MFSGLSTDDMCIDYKRKFGFKFYKLPNNEFQFGICLDKHCYGTYIGNMYEHYLHIGLYKWTISIGWFLEEV